MTNAIKAVDEATLTKDDVKGDLDEQNVARARHEEIRKRIGKRMRSHVDVVDDATKHIASNICTQFSCLNKYSNRGL